MAYARGSVVLAPATFKSGVRPYLVVSNRNRPFFGDRYTVAVITSADRETAVELTAESLTEGELKVYPSYASPWSLHVLRLKNRQTCDGGQRLNHEYVPDGIHELTRVLL